MGNEQKPHRIKRNMKKSEEILKKGKTETKDK